MMLLAIVSVASQKNACARRRHRDVLPALATLIMQQRELITLQKAILAGINHLPEVLPPPIAHAVHDLIGQKPNVRQ